MKRVLDDEAAVREAELRRKEGVEEGKREGRAEGRNEGKTEGIELGEKQGIEKTARQLLLKGMDLEFIKEITGLSEERIQELK